MLRYFEAIASGTPAGVRGDALAPAASEGDPGSPEPGTPMRPAQERVPEDDTDGAP
jgi:hypothetical protein